MRHLFKKLLPSRQLMLVLGCLCILGTMNIFSSGTILSLRDYHTPYHFVGSHLASLIVGLVFCWLLSKIDYHYWNNFKIILTIGGIILLLLLMVKVMGISVNGARRWLGVGRFTFQPSEFAKVAALIIGAYGVTYVRARNYAITFKNLLANWQVWLRNTWPLLLICLFFVLVELQPDLGTASIVLAVALIQYGVGARLKFFKLALWTGPAVAIIGFLYYLIAPENFGYRMNRLAVWWDPWADAQDHGYQTVQSLLAIGSGGLTGLGYGEGFSKFGELPEAHTDFAVSIWAQEYGLLGITILMIILLLLLWILTKAALRTKDYFGKMLIVGGTFLLVGQAIINMAMVSGLLPVVGVPLPFVSYGGTSLVLNFIITGLILSVIFRDEEKEKKAQRKKQELARRKAHEEQKAALRAKLYKMD